MPGQQKKDNTERERIRQLEAELSELKIDLEEKSTLLEEEQGKRLFYQRIADFTNSWELWIEPDRNLAYCSPSSQDLTGYSANQILAAPSISELLVYQDDREKFDDFLKRSLDQLIINQSLEFRIFTRTRQIRWCSLDIRGVYDKQGRYLGIRASVHDITKLKRAMGHIQHLSKGQKLENRTRQRLKTELDVKEREMIGLLLQLSQKNEMISLFHQRLKKVVETHSENEIPGLKELLQIIKEMPPATVEWEMIEIQLEKLHPGFMNRLLVKYTKLTLKEKKLCAFLRLGLSSKEIAGLNNITPKSVEIARVRLRKKLHLNRSSRLVNHLETI
jgi:PAS domain S-box-containing protein